MANQHCRLSLSPLQTTLVRSKTKDGRVHWSYSVLKGLKRMDPKHRPPQTSTSLLKYLPMPFCFLINETCCCFDLFDIHVHASEKRVEDFKKIDMKFMNLFFLLKMWRNKRLSYFVSSANNQSFLDVLCLSVLLYCVCLGHIKFDGGLHSESAFY